MLIKLAAIGALGYVGYRYLRERPEDQNGRSKGRAERIAIAGGPLSEQATIQDSPDVAPAPAWSSDETPRTMQ